MRQYYYLRWTDLRQMKRDGDSTHGVLQRLMLHEGWDRVTTATHQLLFVFSRPVPWNRYVP